MATPLSYRFDALSVCLSGSLVFEAHPAFRRLLGEMPPPAAGEPVRLDLSQVDQLDAAGLGLLLITHDMVAAQGGRLTLTGPRGGVRRVLDVSGLARMVTIED